MEEAKSLCWQTAPASIHLPKETDPTHGESEYCVMGKIDLQGSKAM